MRHGDGVMLRREEAEMKRRSAVCVEASESTRCHAKENAVSASLRLVIFFMLSSFVFQCSLITAFAQTGPPGPSSPLYGARPETGPVQNGLPPALRNVAIEQRLNQQLPLDLAFRDESRQPVKLGQYFCKKPGLFSLLYYDCPMLCTQVLNGMVTAFRVLPFQIGKEFDVVTVSFDPRETATLAAAKKKTYVGYLPQPVQAGANNGWHFLTGDQASIAQLTDAVGFRYHWDEATKQFAHASAIMMATPQGEPSPY